MIHQKNRIEKAPAEHHSAGVFQHIPATALLLAIAVLTQARYLNEYPLYIHAWAQADWYSLARGFADNGMDLLHPAAMFGNKQFAPPSAGEAAPFTIDSTPVTSSDFPLMPYLAALLMKLFGTTAPWVFRGLALVCSLAGLCCLYRAALLLTNSSSRSLLVAATALTAPVFTYYCSGFIPSIPACALTAAGLWAYLLHLRQDELKHFGLAAGCLVLAAMVRSSFWVPFVALLCLEMLRLVRGDTSWRKKWIVVLLALAPAAAWALWNARLRQQYGSMFLGSLMPPRSLENARSIFQNVHDRWRFDYFQRLQHWTVLAAWIAAAGCLIGRSRKKHTGETAPNPTARTRRPAALFVLIWLFGEVLFVTAMMRQYSDHDYYFLDSLFLPLLMLFCLALACIPHCRKRWQRAVECAAILLLLVAMTRQAAAKQQERRPEWDRALQCYRHFEGSARLLDDAGIPRDAKMLALFAYPTSTPFLQMERRGYIVLDTKEALVSNALKFDYDYVVVEKEAWERETELLAPFYSYDTVTQNSGIIVLTPKIEP